MQNKFLIVYGTRPEYIKVKPIIQELESLGIAYKTLFTGQHMDLLQNITPDFTIYKSIQNETNRLDTVVERCLNIPDEYFNEITHIFVQGDTSSAMGLALSAMHRKIKIVHIEAGLRSYDTGNPYPEEYNRKIIAAIADYHFCPTNTNKQNLLDEGIKNNIHVTGNTGLDNLLKYKELEEYTDKVLITLHRRENHNNIEAWFTKINDIAKLYNNIEFILPIHPNPNVYKFKHLLPNVKVIEPLQHDALIQVLIKTKLIITDSGGLQEECSFFNKKCLVCRKTTERQETVGINSFLVNEPTDLLNLFNTHIYSYDISINSPYGDGNAAKKIIKILTNTKA